MFFDSFSAFLAMGGHGFYVWLSYAIGAALIIFNVVTPMMAKSAFFNEQRRRLRREQQLAAQQSSAQQSSAQQGSAQQNNVKEVD